MSDPFGRERPVTKTGTRSQASKNKKSDRVARRDARTLWRSQVAEWARACMVANPEISGRTCYALLLQAIKEGELIGRAPGRGTFFRWLGLGKEDPGMPSLRAYQEKPRSGRPSHEWHPQVAEYFEDLMFSQIYDSAAAVFRDLLDFARLNGLPEPTEGSFKSRYDRFDLAARSAARHGRKAARADALPKSTVPAEYPHHYWSLDELESPVWVQAFDPVQRLLVSVRLWVVLIVDNFSRVIVGYHVCEPFKDGSTTVSFDSEDVNATFFAAALRDLAPQETKAFTGYLPRILRMDGAGQHAELKLMLRKNLIGAEKLEKGTPWSRGSVERLIGGFKQICADIRGHMNGIHPADQVKRLPQELRTDSAATSMRVRRKAVVPVEMLLTINQFREKLGAAVHQYNVMRKHSMIGAPPEVVFWNHLRREELRPGLDATLLLPPVTLTVGTAGLMHRKALFATQVAGRRLPVGEQVICRPAPLRRGLFVEVDGQPYFVPPKVEWARTQNPEHLVAEEKAVAKEYSEAADAAQQRFIRRQFGAPGTAPPRMVAADAPRPQEGVNDPPGGERSQVESVPDQQELAGPVAGHTVAEAVSAGPRKRGRGQPKTKPVEEPAAHPEFLVERPVLRVVNASPNSSAAHDKPRLPRGMVTSRMAHLRVEK